VVITLPRREEKEYTVLDLLPASPPYPPVPRVLKGSVIKRHVEEEEAEEGLITSIGIGPLTVQLWAPPELPLHIYIGGQRIL